MRIALSETDTHHLRATIAAARPLARAGRVPFTARLVTVAGELHSFAQNESEATGDPTAHAEMMLLRRTASVVSREELAGMTLYAAAEPCAMCASAIVWSGVGRVVYGLPAAKVRARDPLPAGVAEPGVGGRRILEVTSNGPEIVGPMLEEEAAEALFPNQSGGRVPDASAPPLGRIVESALYVDDLARAHRFYVDVLGARVLLDTARLVALDVNGESVLLLFQRGATLTPLDTPGGRVPPHGGEGIQHLAFAIAAGDLTAWAAHLDAKGVAIESRVRWPRSGESLYLRDPEGHSIELITPGLWATY